MRRLTSRRQLPGELPPLKTWATTRSGELGQVIAHEDGQARLQFNGHIQGLYAPDEMTWLEQVPAREGKWVTAGEDFHFASQDYPELEDILNAPRPQVVTEGNEWGRTASRKTAEVITCPYCGEQVVDKSTSTTVSDGMGGREIAHEECAEGRTASKTAGELNDFLDGLIDGGSTNLGDTCPDCDGKGFIDVGSPTYVNTCEKCGGTGFVAATPSRYSSKTADFKPTHTYNPIGWDQFFPSAGNTLEGGETVQVTGPVGDPQNKFVYVVTEDGTEASVDRKSLDKLSTKTAGAAGWYVIQRGTGVTSGGPYAEKNEAEVEAWHQNTMYGTNEYLATELGGTEASKTAADDDEDSTDKTPDELYAERSRKQFEDSFRPAFPEEEAKYGPKKTSADIGPDGNRLTHEGPWNRAKNVHPDEYMAGRNAANADSLNLTDQEKVREAERHNGAFWSSTGPTEDRAYHAGQADSYAEKAMGTGGRSQVSFGIGNHTFSPQELGKTSTRKTAERHLTLTGPYAGQTLCGAVGGDNVHAAYAPEEMLTSPDTCAACRAIWASGDPDADPTTAPDSNQQSLFATRKKATEMTDKVFGKDGTPPSEGDDIVMDDGHVWRVTHVNDHTVGLASDDGWTTSLQRPWFDSSRVPLPGAPQVIHDNYRSSNRRWV